MAAIIDLTEEFSSDVEAANENTLPTTTSKPTMSGETARKPFQTVQNNAKPAQTGDISRPLRLAIQTLSESTLRAQLTYLCGRHEGARADLERSLLVKGRDVERYHVDSESEDDQESELESEESEDEDKEEEDDEDEDEDARADRKRKPIAVADDEWTAKWAKCENCKEEFDVTSNYRGYCRWHTEAKSVDYESEFWDDHDENCHGRFESFEDEPDYAEGFIWHCCGKPGDDEGCKFTKHKAKVNVVIPAKQENTQHFPAGSLKRKAEEALVRPGLMKVHRI